MGLPHSDTAATSSSAQPSRAQASDSDDGAGTQIVSSAGTWADNMAPTPKQYGIAGGEHGDRLAAMGEDCGYGLGDWAWPGLALAARQAVG